MQKWIIIEFWGFKSYSLGIQSKILEAVKDQKISHSNEKICFKHNTETIVYGVDENPMAVIQVASADPDKITWMLGLLKSIDFKRDKQKEVLITTQPLASSFTLPPLSAVHVNAATTA